jgi:hypothetical protein
VSPGYLQDIDIRSKQLREFKLGQITDEQIKKESPKPRGPFTTPEGYQLKEYTELEKEDREDCEKQKSNKKK